MRRVCRFSKFQNFTSSKPTFRIYVPSWLPTPVRKSCYQTHCNFLSNFETRDFCRVLRNAPSNGRAWPLVKNSGARPNYKPSALTVTRSVSQHTTKISGLKITQKITVSLITWFTHWSWEPGRYVDSEGRFRTGEILEFWKGTYSTHINFRRKHLVSVFSGHRYVR